MSKKLVLILLLVFIPIAVFNLVNQIIGGLKAGDRLTEASQELYNLQMENNKLQEKLKQVSSPLFLEGIARDKLGLAKNGETVIIIPPERLHQVLGAALDQKPPRLPNWQGWLKLFF